MSPIIFAEVSTAENRAWDRHVEIIMEVAARIEKNAAAYDAECDKVMTLIRKLEEIRPVMDAIDDQEAEDYIRYLKKGIGLIRRRNGALFPSACYLKSNIYRAQQLIADF